MRVYLAHYIKRATGDDMRVPVEADSPGQVEALVRKTFEDAVVLSVKDMGPVDERLRCTFAIPVVVISELNWRGHYMARYQRLRKHKEAAYTACIANVGPRRQWSSGFCIILTRIKGPRQRDFDSDNLAAAFKGVRDGIATYLDIDDGSQRLEWLYRQKKGTSAGVVVEVVAERFSDVEKREGQKT